MIVLIPDHCLSIYFVDFTKKLHVRTLFPSANKPERETETETERD